MNESVYIKTSEQIKESISVREVAYHATKRVFDIFVSTVGLIFLLPLMIIIKLSYMLSGDFESIFFTQNRIGKDGKEFKFYKFRTMIPNADEVLFKMLQEDEDLAREYKINKKLKNDPRITRMGKVLPKTSLDELPQLINVFLGDMTMIGNRPYLPREKEDMGFFFREIVKTKPGLTGYWQVSGRSDTTFERRLELEQFYSNNYSFKLDVEIFIRTFLVVFKGK